MRLHLVTNILCLIFVAGYLAGCSTDLRAPVCTPDNLDFPALYTGTYRFTYADTNAEFSGINGFKDMIFEITGNKVQLARRDFARLSARFKTEQVINEKDDVAHIIGGGLACKIGDAYYLQNRNANGTYSVSRIDFADTAITLVTLSFDVDTMNTFNIPVVFLPAMRFGEKKAIDIFSSSTRMIVDNRFISASELMKHAQAVSFGVVATRVLRAAPLSEQDTVTVQF